MGVASVMTCEIGYRYDVTWKPSIVPVVKLLSCGTHHKEKLLLLSTTHP